MGTRGKLLSLVANESGPGMTSPVAELVLGVKGVVEKTMLIPQLVAFVRKLQRQPQQPPEVPPGSVSSSKERRFVLLGLEHEFPTVPVPPAKRRLWTMAVMALAIGGLVLGGVLLFSKDSRERSAEYRSDSGSSGNREENPSFPVNVNTATVQELDAIPYVSSTVAEAIIAHRPYASHEDLLKVPGIKERMLERIRPYTSVEPPK